MRFLPHKHRTPPSIIIISLIDILIVLLIFLMVTTTFKQTPSVKLTLPESKQPKEGVTPNTLVVTIAKTEPFFYLQQRPVTYAKLQEEFTTRAKKDPKLTVSIRADADAQWAQVVKVMDAAKAANVKAVSAFTKTGK